MIETYTRTDTLTLGEGGEYRIVTCCAYHLASNEVKLLGHSQQVDLLLTMKTCDESIHPIGGASY